MALSKPFAGDHHCDTWEGVDQGTAQQRLERCTTNPGHRGFFTVQEFRNNSIPIPPLSTKKKDEIWRLIKNTVRVKVSCTSKHRPETYPDSDIPYPLKDLRGNNYILRYGTGFLQCIVNRKGSVIDCGSYGKIDVGERCPCIECKNSHSQHQTSSSLLPKFSAYFVITTATHVLFDSLEAQHAVFEFFYDDERREDVEFVYGVGVVNSERRRLDTDVCYVACVTHDARLYDLLSDRDLGLMSIIQPLFSQCVLVSHPHGVSKRISFGRYFADKLLAINAQKSPITMKRGLKVRFTGELETEDEVVAILNLAPLFEKPNIRMSMTRTYFLSSDVTICSPVPVTLHRDHTTDHTCLGFELEFDDHIPYAWWTLPAGVELAAVTGDNETGRHVTIPYPSHSANDGKESFGFKMEFHLTKHTTLNNTPVQCFSDDEDKPVKWRICRQFHYNMAACPGSSGAPVPIWHHILSFDPFDYVSHFGCMGKNSKSGLWG